MKAILTNKFGMILMVFVILVGLSACYNKDDSVRKLPADSVGAISFNGKGIVLLNKQGKPVKPVKENRKGTERSMATLSIIKVNPCYVKWCPSGSECEYYKISDDACPAWW